MSDYTFASALLSTKSAGLLSKSQFRDLQTTDDDGFLLKLQALGYGINAKNVLVETILESEVLALKEELIQILPHDNLPLFFFSKYDLTNIRSYYKNKLFKVEISAFEEAGFLTKKDLEKVIIRNDYFSLEEPYKSLFSSTIDQTFTNAFELANFLQNKFQTLIFNEIKERKDEVLEYYFVISTDISNLLSLLRARRMKLSEEQLRQSLLNHGLFTRDDIVTLFASQPREIVSRYSSLYMSRFVKPLEQYFDDNNFAMLEQSLMYILLDENRQYLVDITSSAAIIDYVVRKQIEIIDIRRLYLDRRAVLMVNLS